MTGRMFDGLRGGAGRLAGVVLMAIAAAVVAAAPAEAGSSTHAKTTPGATAAPDGAEAGKDAREAEDTGTIAEKTAKAESAARAEAAEDSEPGAPADEAAASPIGAGWQTDTLIRPRPEDQEITDLEALELIERINVYFNNLGKLKARFVQTDAKNERKTGDFYFQRPGKVRFDYNRPSMMKIISDGKYLAVENHDLRTSDRYPLESTPFKLLLAEEVNLLRDARILSLDKGENVLILAMEDKSGESPGQIRLFFSTDPELELASWIITDPQGLDTRVDIADLERDVELSAKLFQFSNIGLPTFQR